MNVDAIGDDALKKKLSRKAQKKMKREAARGEWRGLIPRREVPEFSAWMTDERHKWQSQSPDAGEVLRVYRDGITLNVLWDGKRTICGRHMMALWYTFCCFRNG